MGTASVVLASARAHVDFVAGTYTTLSDLYPFEEGAGDAGKREDSREVFNYVRALETAIAELAELPISSRLLRNAHRILLTGVQRHRGGQRRSGGS